MTAYQEHSQALSRRHQELERELLRAYAFHYPDEDIMRLKKKKLAVKDALTRLKHLRMRRVA